MSRLAIVVAAAVLAGCAGSGTVPYVDPRPEPRPPKANVDECSRQFDENEAGFQTCLP